jgi:BirA family transcriptional regulator, biotin operon repressor / biotin---[acetyl-CoA-carboxylase] ligase
MSSKPFVPELLDAEKIRAKIAPANLHLLSKLDIFDSINSTSSYLMERAKSGGASGWLCFAEQQSKGRGRLGRVWHSPRGANIYCSMLWRFPLEQQNISTLSLAIAVMMVDVLQKYGVNADIALKWPNDILCAKRKLAGILLERFQPPEAGVVVVIGVGINLGLSGDVNPDWIDVAEITGKTPRRNELAGILVDELLGGLLRYQKEGWEAFRGAWEKHDVLRGKEVKVWMGGRDIYGVMQGVNEKGELLLKMGSGEIHSFASGEVSVRY